jgi:Flp pilus assembly pilin Flp
MLLLKRVIFCFLRDEQGQDLVEYALIVAAVGLTLIAVVGQLGAAISSVYLSIIGGLGAIGAQ